MRKSFLLQTLVVSMMILLTFSGYAEEKCEKDFVTIAILAKDKEHMLDLFLESIENQTWPKSQTYIYVRTNNNNDNTPEILKKWIEKVKNQYAEIYFDDKDVKQKVQEFNQHEWNSVRFKVLGKIRQDSIDWAKKRNSHYFVIDCDNFIKPDTLEKIFQVHLPIVAPFLKKDDGEFYSNYHSNVDKNGYFASNPFYHQIFSQQVRGLIEVPVVHCTYLIRKEFLDKMSYDDNSERYEYVIFSDIARKNNIPQYLDNREMYGRLTFAESQDELLNENWIHEFTHLESGKKLLEAKNARDNSQETQADVNNASSTPTPVDSTP